MTTTRLNLNELHILAQLEGYDTGHYLDEDLVIKSRNSLLELELIDEMNDLTFFGKEYLQDTCFKEGRFKFPGVSNQ